MKYWSVIVVVGLLFVSCGESPEKFQDANDTALNPFIFQLEHYYLEEESVLSFPMWFNDSIIRTRGIQTITRTIYTSTTEADTTDREPKAINTYTFSEEGWLSGLDIEHFYDNQLVGSMSFSFTERDEYDYSPVLIRMGEMSEADIEILEQFTMYDKKGYHQKSLVYTDKRTGDYLFYMLDEKNWGPLSIDSILHPLPDDLVALGTPKKPSKKYQVENRVNEFNVVDYAYTQGFIDKISFQKYPFNYTRSILYNEKGNCTGFVDSTFSNEKYLTRRESMFLFNQELPVRLIHENKSEKSEVSYYQFETYAYTYFE